MSQINNPPPGQMVDIGDFRLHAILKGTGTPTVLFEPALGGFALQYKHIQTGVSAFTRTLAYDRAGQGWSEVSPNPRSPVFLADELRCLLAKVNLRPPYVLVGHSFGGLIARVYAGLHPDEVSGMVLVDANHTDEYAPFPNIDQFIRQSAMLVHVMKIAYRLGLAKMLTRLSMGPNAKFFAKDDLNTILSIASQPKHLETQVAEFRQHRSYFGPQSIVPRTLANLPLVVVTAGNSISGKAKVAGKLTGDEMNVLHQKLQKDLVQLSTRGEQVIVPNATHFSIFSQPEHAALVIDAIRRVVEQARA